MTPIELRFSALARALIIAGFAVLALVTAAMIWAERILLSTLETLELQTALSALTLVPVLAFLIYIGFQGIRVRRALTTDYVLSEQGITMRRASEPVREIAGTQFQAGTYQRLAKVLTLRALENEETILLTNTGGKRESPEWRSCRELIVSKLGPRLQTEWL